MIPPFSENAVEKYFTLFEHVTHMFKWPKNTWSLLLQCVFIGKAQEVLASLSPEVSLYYETFKATVLRADKLVPEAYCQKFWQSKKAENLTEFGCEKGALFDHWCQSKNMSDVDNLHNRIVL